MTTATFNEAKKLVEKIEKLEKVQADLQTADNGISSFRFTKSGDLSRYELDKEVVAKIEGIITFEIDSAIKSAKAKLKSL